MEPHAISFTVDGTRYSLKDAKILGTGRFGVVTTATDKLQDGRKIAIKRIRPFANDERHARQTLREVRSMKLVGSHPNVITLYDVSLNEAKSELYMMMELMDCDLHQIIQSKQPLTEMHHKSYTKQILEGIKAMHEVGIIHRDLKPENLLVSKDCRLRIADFGNACFVNETRLVGAEMPGGGGSLWYCCPELLRAPYRLDNPAIDLWSIGCIVAELFRREPLFPGKSHDHQEFLIFQAFGFYSNQHHIRSVVPNASPEAIDLITALLSIDPLMRPPAAQALSFGFLHNAETLFEYDKIHLSRPPKALFDFQTGKYSLDELKRLILDEVSIYELRNDALKAVNISFLMSFARDGAQHFAWNNILDYLTFKDVVKLLTVVVPKGDFLLSRSQIYYPSLHLLYKTIPSLMTSNVPS